MTRYHKMQWNYPKYFTWSPHGWFRELSLFPKYSYTIFYTWTSFFFSPWIKVARRKMSVQNFLCDQHVSSLGWLRWILRRFSSCTPFSFAPYPFGLPSKILPNFSSTFLISSEKRKNWLAEDKRRITWWRRDARCLSVVRVNRNCPAMDNNGESEKQRGEMKNIIIGSK